MAQKNLPIIPHIHRLKKNNSMNISVDERDKEKKSTENFTVIDKMLGCTHKSRKLCLSSVNVSG